MITTKSEILALLKRNGGHSVAELATGIDLAPITIRQHLTHLQRDGLVLAEQQSQAIGRPHYIYRLSAKGHAAAFPGRSDRLVELLLREIGLLDGRELEGRSPQEKTKLVLERLAHRLADEYVPLLQGWPLQERVVFVTEVMQADGGFAEWERTASGYEIRDYNCLFHRLLRDEGEVCQWHRNFLGRMLGMEVQVSPCPDGAGQCCRYLVEEQSAAPVESALAVDARS
jgi:predicted ArsR family transcriptional regulator